MLDAVDMPAQVTRMVPPAIPPKSTGWLASSKAEEGIVSPTCDTAVRRYDLLVEPVAFERLVADVITGTEIVGNPVNVGFPYRTNSRLPFVIYILSSS